MDKIELLKEQAQTLKLLLQQHKTSNQAAASLLRLLTPLFDDIAANRVVPPKLYEYRMAMGKDSAFYEQDSPFSQAEAAFIGALEDWASQPWYQEALMRQVQG